MPAIANNKISEPGIILKDISIKNFRCFEDIEIEFDSRLNVIIGENGSGKTAILDAIAKFLSIIVHEMLGEDAPPEKIADPPDMQYGSQKAILRANIPKDGEKKECEIALFFDDDLGIFRTKISNPGFGLGSILKKIPKYDPTHPPLFAYYPAAHAPLGHIDFRGVANQTGIHDLSRIYNGIPEGKHYDFQGFFAWYKWQENIEKQLGENKVLDIIRKSIYFLLTDDKNTFESLSINWLNDPNGEMFIIKNGVPLNINQLSSGEKILLVMAADLALRLAVANPRRENPLCGHGIVLIDEVDLHLHPSWQRAVIPKLQNTFPNCQFIVTTHSPLVLGKIKPRHIIVLSDFKALEEKPYTYGRDANSILYELMGVEKRPEEIQKQIDKVYELVDEEKIEDARKLLRVLSEDLGENDHEIIRARTHIDFMKD